MSKHLSKYRNEIKSRAMKKSINHANSFMLHKMSESELEEKYKKYYSEQANIELALNVNNAYEQLDKEELDKYEKWLSESD